MAVLPCSDVVGTFARFQPLAQYLRQQLGAEVELLFPKDAKQLEGFLRKGLVDFAFQEPAIYVRLDEWFQGDTALQTLDEQGRSVNHGLVIVRKDSGVRRIEDLKGKVVEFGAEGSTPKWVAARWLFRQHGMDPDVDLKYYYHGGCCEDIAFTVYFKAADAGILCSHAFARLRKTKTIDSSQLMVIAETADVPTWIFSAAKTTRSEVVRAVNRALLGLSRSRPDRAAILEQAQVGGFVQADRERLNDLRKKMR